MIRYVLCLIFAFYVSATLFAQALEGHVVDEQGIDVPYATVFLEGTRYAALSDEQGYFSMNAPSGTYQIVVSHLGYEQAKVSVEIPYTDKLVIQLNQMDVNLETVEITSGKRDPAYAIMQQVIANKKNFVRQFDTYSCETYLKLVLKQDTLPKRKVIKALEDSLGVPYEHEWGKETFIANFIESRSSTFFRSPGTYKSIVQAYKDLSDEKINGLNVSIGGEEDIQYKTQIRNPYLFYQDVSDVDVNFYRNLIQAPVLGDRPFISPLHSTSWRLMYKYKLMETWFEDGRVTYRIRVTPKNQEGPYFKGEMVIVDEIWALKSVDFEILPSTLSLFKSFRLEHDYSRTNDQRWVLDKETYTYEIREGRSRYYGTSVAMHDNYELDPTFEKNFFGNELKRTEREAFERDSLYWAGIRPVALSTAETSFVRTQDSVIAYRTSDEYLAKQDSIYNRLSIVDILFEGIAFRSRPNGIAYAFSPVVEQINPFGVGGYRHSLGGMLRKRFDRGYDLRVSGSLDYGFAVNDLKGRGEFSFTYLPKKFGRAYFKYGNIYSMVFNVERFANVFSPNNFINKVYVGGGHAMEIFNGFMLDANVEFADYKAIDQEIIDNWLLPDALERVFGELEPIREFDTYRQFVIDVKVRYTPGQKYVMEPYRKVRMGSDWPTFKLHYKKAIPGIANSEINFDFLELGIEQDFRLGTFGNSRYNVVAGTFIQANNLRFIDYKFFRGSDAYLFFPPLQGFQLLGPTVSTPNEYFEAHFMHDFNGSLIDKIPLLKRTRLQIAGGAGTLAVRDSNLVHTEVFAGLQYPFRIKKSRFKAGVYFATSYSTRNEAIRSQIKFGLTFFNPLKNKWEY